MIDRRALVPLIAALALAGCGGDDDSGKSRLLDPGTSGTLKDKACKVVSAQAVAGIVEKEGAAAPRNLSQTASNSLDISRCNWTGRPVELVSLQIDAAPRAELRFYNMISEQHEYYNQDPARRARQIKGVGDDSAYGGAGAWWTRARSQLIAFRDNRILRVRVVVKGLGDAQKRDASVQVARLAFQRMSDT
ncbi:MAG TPA: hypothetical protein VGF25_02115 [Thermoleophilaceae bacterium]